jgi:hypothetical protein
MSRKSSIPDPIRKYQRKATAARRVGEGARCACGESRPEALLTRSSSIVCAACDRKSKGQTTNDKHHVAGKANSPISVTVFVNDHRAELNTAQYEWPKMTRVNPTGDPNLKIAGGIRGVILLITYLDKFLLSGAEHLERPARDRWPKGMLEDPTGSPNLKATAGIRRVIDLRRFLCDKFLLPAAEHLESLAENSDHES